MEKYGIRLKRIIYENPLKKEKKADLENLEKYFKYILNIVDIIKKLSYIYITIKRNGL
jgi:hypothetical protein